MCRRERWSFPPATDGATLSEHFPPTHGFKVSTLSTRTLTSIVRELADYEGEDLDRDEIADIVHDADTAISASGRNARIDTPFGEWLITSDGYELAIEYVEEMLEVDPEAFNQDWLRGHMTMSPTDIRVYAGDYADSVAEGMSASDLEDEIDAMPSVIRAQEALDDAQEAYAIAFDEGTEDEQDAADDAVIEAQADLDAAREDALEKARELWASAYAEEIAAELRRDALGWFEDQFGKGQYPKNLLTLDVREAAVDAVDTDGPAHFLANYDGEEVDITVNGKTYQCYRTN